MQKNSKIIKNKTKKMIKALFPGSFDPFTKGHADIVNRALPLFDRIIIAFGTNSSKTRFIKLQYMVDCLEKMYEKEPKIEITTYSGLTVEFCKKNSIQFILRGLRNSTDFEYERTIAHLNQSMDKRIETVFLATTPENSSVTSTIVREIIRFGGDASNFVPSLINDFLKIRQNLNLQ